MKRFRALRLARLYSRFAPLLAPHRRTLLLAGLCMLGFIAANLLTPWPVALVIDGVLLDKPSKGALGWARSILPTDASSLLIVSCVSVVLIAVLRGYFSFGQNLLTATAGHRVVSELRTSIFTRLQRLSLGYHSRQRTGDLVVRMTGDVSMLREILVPAVLSFMSDFLMLIGMLALMATMDPWLTVVAVGMVPLLMVVTVRYGSRIRAVAHEQRRKEGRIANIAGEALASVTMVQAYSREDEVAARFTRHNMKGLNAGLKSLRLEETLLRIVEITLAAGSCLVLWLGARRAMSGALSPGEMIVFLTYVRGVYKPIQSIVRLSTRSSKAVACGERILEVLDSKEEVAEAPDAVEAPPLRGEIRFENVTFGYEPDRPVLRGISFVIRPGEKVGLVGPSGSGKSTILSLLLRLHEPQGGRILVDGTDIGGFKLESYRRQIAVVLQEPFLFGVSVEENIEYGRPDATSEEIQSAARAAGADGFIEDLPDGYGTILGERGTSLSRGQQQRIALARAVVRDAPILVYDEPTTGLDARSEAGVVKTLAVMGEGRTRLWIAHGLDQILGCPRIIVIRDGRIVEDGEPAALIEKAGNLRHLYGAAL